MSEPATERDIVERLRSRRCPPAIWMGCGLSECTCRIQADAAAEIERLRAVLADEQPGAGWEARG